MVLKLFKTKNIGKNILYTLFTSIMLCILFLALFLLLYNDTKEEAYEALHMQTKQIKDDLTLQMLSDRENLATMANFASKLYRDGEDYQLLFDSFKPIGLIENIGILNSQNTFTTKSGSIYISDNVFFAEEAAKGAHITGRVPSLYLEGVELVRSAVPITVDNEVVGILYGIIPIDRIKAKYNTMAQELDAQLFVYEKITGDLIIDTVHEKLGNISFLKDRRYLEDYSYEQIRTEEKGFSSFESVYRPENVHMHYSNIDDLGWAIAVVRYDSQVFANLNSLTTTLIDVFVSMIIIISVYILILMSSEKQTSKVTSCASDVRKILLESSGDQDHISEALKMICNFTGSRSAVFFDTNGNDYNHISRDNYKSLTDDKKQIFMSELFRYIAEAHNQAGTAIRVIHLRPNSHLSKINPSFYELLKEHDIKDVIFSATVNNANHVSILCLINSKKKTAAQMLAEKISACFSMTLSNKEQFNITKLAAITDSLTGALNRVAYRNDILEYNEEKPLNFSCIYIDVNELHIRNNKYGHADGDKMLLYIANSLKKVFFGNKVYRMGGDEFLVFCHNLEEEDIKKGIDIFLGQLDVMGYHVAVGMSYRSQNTNTDDMVREAEIKMYEEKAKYYQNKEQQGILDASGNEYIQAKTGIPEIDAIISILKESYCGIYRVSLDTDSAKAVLMPAYLKYNETEDNFSTLFSKYISESVFSDYHRSLTSFKNYDALKQQLSNGRTPKITYKKLNGEMVTLGIYKLSSENISDTLWVFAKTKES